MVAIPTFARDVGYPGAGPRGGGDQPLREEGGAVVTSDAVQAGQSVLVPLVKVKPEYVPDDAGTAAQPPPARPGQLTGTVWFDFTRGGGGQPNVPDAGGRAAGVRSRRCGTARSSPPPPPKPTARSRWRGCRTGRTRSAPPTFTAPTGARVARRHADHPRSSCRTCQVWAGFAMVLIAAGLAAIPRDALEAARVDGATEWQVFRRVTIPLAPVLMRLVTLTINVLKVDRCTSSAAAIERQRARAGDVDQGVRQRQRPGATAAPSPCWSSPPCCSTSGECGGRT